MVKLIFELLGPYYKLASAEVKAVIEGKGFNWREKNSSKEVLVLETDCSFDYIAPRLGLTHRVLLHYYSGSQEEVVAGQLNIELPEGSAKVETRRIVGTPGETQKIKNILGNSIRNPIDLIDPDHQVLVLLSDQCHIGRLLYSSDKEGYKKRAVKNRPFFFPISLEPRYARALINLARVKEGDTLHDPFCGTGGVLLEALFLGLRTSGGDIDRKMVLGCRRNLKEFGVNCKLEVGDVAETIPNDLDNIVTDPPYGRASSTSGEDAANIYRRLFQTARERLIEGGYLVVILPDKKYVELAKGFNLIEGFSTKVHSSLERHYLVFQKINL
ncbi:MAG: methyltransferase [Thermoplasmata archaeon]